MFVQVCGTVYIQVNLGFLTLQRLRLFMLLTDLPDTCHEDF